ncbi:ATP-binding cassette domain-containing protein [Kitasatospora sp. NPDC059463]|uniref:ATP-binding cassette domain-containing protein n=1 Tax=unclassified Kitasatospora TaxID=2633591 RepID=UPI0036C3C48B
MLQSGAVAVAVTEAVAVGKRYGRGPWILRDVDLRLDAGDVLAVLGANGSGKSTLLRILAGLTRPTTGRLTHPAARRRAAVGVGYVPDRFTAHERLTAAGYLTHLGRIRGLPTATARRRAGELLDRLALVGGPDAALRTLSKGNAQKVALAQALLLPPDLLVLDEPWSGLDASAHTVLAELIAETAADGGAVVFTDHREAVAEAQATATRTLADGRLSRWAPVADPSAPPDPSAEIVLTGTDTGTGPGTGPGAPDWRALPGVLALSRRGPELHLRVAQGHTDAVLLAALRHGCSVHAVTRPATAPASPAASAPRSATR